MYNLGIFLLNSNSDLSFDSSIDVFDRLFDETVSSLSKFVFDIYGIEKTWEKEAFEYYLRDKLECKAYFIEFNKNTCAFFSEMLTKENIHRQTRYFLPDECGFSDESVCVVYYYFDDNELIVGVLKEGDSATFSLEKKHGEKSNVTKMQNEKMLNQYLLKEDFDLCQFASQNSIIDVVDKLCESTGLLFNVSYDVINREPGKFKAHTFSSMD